MPKYIVTITETLKRKVEIEAETELDAEQTVIDEYYSGVHVLEAEDFVETNFSVEKK